MLLVPSCLTFVHSPFKNKPPGITLFSVHNLFLIGTWTDSRRDGLIPKTEKSSSQELGLKGKWAMNRGRVGSLLSSVSAFVPGA